MQITSSEFITSSNKLLQCPKDNLNEFAFIGRSNVGKSSLINMICGRKNLARISVTPGKTQLINHFLINKEFYFVDLPGYGYARVSKVMRKEFGGIITDYILKRETMLLLFVLIDIRLEPQKIDIEFINYLGNNQVPFNICFTKCDKLKPAEIEKNKMVFENELLKTWENLPQSFLTSSVERKGKEDILQYIKSLQKRK